MTSLQLARPTLLNMGDKDEDRVARGLEIQRRRLALGFDVAPLARRVGIGRDTLTKIEAGGRVRETSLTAVERTLDDLDENWGPAVPGTAESSTVRFVVRGVYGAEALVVEGPVESIAALEESVDRIMRRLRGNGDEG